MGVKVDDTEFAAIQIARDNFHGEWNMSFRRTDKGPRYLCLLSVRQRERGPRWEDSGPEPGFPFVS